MVLIATAIIAAVTAVAQGMQARSNAARSARQARNAKALEDSAQSKAEGTSTILENTRSSEEQAATLRQSLQLQGAARASADSAGVGGSTVDDMTHQIEMQGMHAMTLAREDAKNKVAINRMNNKSRFEASFYTTKTFRPTSMASILGNAAISAAATYYGGKAMQGAGGAGAAAAGGGG